MAKPTKYALPISLGLGLIALISGILALKYQNVLFALAGILPIIGYEIYRVEGKSTRWASWGLLAVVIAEILLIKLNISFNLGSFLGIEHKIISGYDVPLTDIKIFGPILMAIFSSVLFKNTRGKYTKLLSVFIFLVALLIVYLLNPDTFTQVMQTVIREILNYIPK